LNPGTGIIQSITFTVAFSYRRDLQKEVFNLMNGKHHYPFYFLILSLAIYTVLFFLPSLFSFYYALTDWNAFSDEIHFIGFDNFKDLFSADSLFVTYLTNTIIFALLTSLLKNLVGLGLALALKEGLRTRNLLRTIFFLPLTISPLIIGLIFSSIFDANHGLLNGFLSMVGLESWSNGWLIDLKYAMASVISVETWKYAGLNMIIFLAGLQTISPTYFEAASIDGANSWQKFINITFPLLIPSFMINLILNLISGFKVFDLVFVLTRGGPGNATEVLNTAVFNEFSAGRYGSATAIGVVIFILTCVVALSTLAFLSKRARQIEE
jgi:raffinose/stachyose/melibiose transport system permease protein